LGLASQGANNTINNLRRQGDGSNTAPDRLILG